MFIVGQATQEATLWDHMVKWITGNGWFNKVTAGGGNVGNGKVINIQVGPNYQYMRFDLTLTSVSPNGGEFTVTMTDTRDGTVTPLPTTRVNEVYDEWTGVPGASDHIVQWYIDFGNTDFALGDTFTIDVAEKTWADQVGNNNANTPDAEQFATVVDTVTEVITLDCISGGGAEAIAKADTITFAAYEVWVDIPGYQNITVTSLSETVAGVFVEGDDFSVDTVNGQVMAHAAGSNPIPLATPCDIVFNATYTPAIFSVTGSVSGVLANYTQGLDAVYTMFDWFIPDSSDLQDLTELFYPGDQFLFNTTQNELTASSFNWVIEQVESTWSGDQNQFGTIGGPGLADGDYEHLTFRAPGLSLDREIYVSIQRDWNNTNQWARWRLFGMKNYDHDLLFHEQIGLTKGNWVDSDWENPIMNFWDGALPYWIIADGQRLLVGCRNNQAYKQMYLGLYYAYDFPSVNPYPMAVGGSASEITPDWNSTNNRNTNFWQHMANGGSSEDLNQKGALEIFEGIADSRRCWHEFSDTDNDDEHWIYNRDDQQVFPWNQRQTRKLRKNLDGSFPLIANRIGRFTGQLSGLFATCGVDGQQPENILYDEVNDRKFVVHRNNDRLSGYQYCALELS